MWLRDTDGFPVAERGIRKHEWIDDLYGPDDEAASPEGDGRSTFVRRARQPRDDRVLDRADRDVSAKQLLLDGPASNVEQ